VCDVDEAVFGGDAVGPPFDFGSLDFDGGTALTAHEVVMVVLGATTPVERLSGTGSQGIDLTRLGEGS
jgi:hypothetical protein